MKNTVINFLEQVKQSRSRRRKAAAILVCLSLIVAGGTAWALHINGESQTGETWCGYTEHQHDDTCVEKALVCGYATEENAEPDPEQVPAHTHTDECYEITYICGYEYEHTHSLSCFSNPEADAETAGDWEKTVSNVELTGDFATDLVAIARTQLGYTESTENYQVVLDAEGNETEQTKGYTRYGAWYGMPYEDWCAMFVSFCLNYADITDEMVPYDASCPDWVESLSELGFYEPVLVEKLDEDGNTVTVRNDYTPEMGDLIFFDWDGDGSSDHVGIVEELETKETTNDEGTISYEYIIHTIEGNSADQVAERKYDLEDETILGYDSLYRAYVHAVDEEMIENVRHLTAETEDGVTFSAIGEIPENAVLEVSPLTEEQNAYLQENGLTGYFYDIKILVDGEKYQPDSPVKISVSGLGYDVSTVLEGCHLTVDAEDLMTSEDFETLSVDVQNTGNRIAFEADSFSIYGVGELVADDYASSDVTKVNSLTIKLITRTYNTSTKEYDQEYANDEGGEILPSDEDYPCYEYTESNTHYYLIPVGYLSEKYKNSGFEFSETQVCPFVYLTDATTLDWTQAPAGSYVKISGEYYLQVKCASGSTPVICYTVLTVATDTVTPSNTVINMFDYWTTANRLDSDNHKSTLTDLNGGINSGHVLKFGKNMGGSPGWLNYSWGGTGETQSKVTAGIVKTTLGTDGYPALSGDTSLGMAATDTYSLSYLFNPTEEVTGKQSFTKVTGLLSVDSLGYFYYNSAERYAQLNEETKAFTVYEQPAGHNTSLKVLGLGEDTYGQFYPYNDGHQVALLDNAEDPINHYFGMTLTTKFIQRNSGYTSIAKSTPITFEFSGDNDVWIFIDDVLVADLGGLSSARSVKIDFSTGEVNVKDGVTNPSTTLRKAFQDAGKEDSVDWQSDTSNTFADNTTHTLKFYYLERGNYDSNLMLKYNLIDIPATSIFKVDQYGDDVGGATFAVYQYDSTADKGTADTDEYGYITTGGATVSLKYLTQVDSEGGVTTNSYYVDPVSGVITVNKENTSYTIKPVYVGQTDSEGEMIFMDEEGITYSQSELRDAFGEYFVLREIKVPDGYRTVSDDVILYFKDKLLQCYDPYSTGVWANPNALVTATDTLHIADSYGNTGFEDNDAIDYYDPINGTTTGTLFAVVLKRDAASSETISDVTADTIKSWEPVYGNDVEGYTTVSFGTGCDYQSQLEAILAAAKKAAEYNYDITFTYGANGMQLLFENLPGDASSYYTYLLDNGGNTSDSEYVIAYFYTTADSVASATTENTVRVRSHGQTATEGTTGYDAFTVQWGATIEVPNIINALYFQKADSDGDLLDDAVFALYDAVADANNKGYYVGTDVNNTTVYIRLDEANGTAKDGTATVYTALGAESGTAGTYTINTTDLSVPADGEGTGYITAEGIGTITVDAGNQTYTIIPATNAGSQNLVGYTHNTCSYVTNEKGTGHFHLLKKGTYYLKEIAPPDGYSLNYVNVPVEVTEEGVYASAGTVDNDVRVGNGAGYLVKTMDVFASLGEIDETLSWIYTHLKVENSSNGDFLNNLDETFYVHSGYTDDYAFDGYGKSSGKSTSYIPVGALTSGTNDNLIKVSNTDGESNTTSFPIEGAMTQYLRYEGDLTETVDTKSVFDYALYKGADGSIRGVQSYRLWTESGWSDLAIYQDYTYGKDQNTTTAYTDLTDYGEISYLFSSSTFVQVTDAVDVDLTVTKVTTDFETSSGSAVTTYLDGAEFYLTNSTGEYYSYNATTDTTSWVGKNDTNPAPTKLTTETYFTYGEDKNRQTVKVNTQVFVENGIVTKTYTIDDTAYKLTSYSNGEATFTDANGNTLSGTLQRSFFKIYNLTEGTYTLKEVTAPTYSLTLGGITEDKSFKTVDDMTITLASGEYWYYVASGTGNTIIVPSGDILTKESITIGTQTLEIPKTFNYRTEDGTVVVATVDKDVKDEKGGYKFTFTYNGAETTNYLYLNNTSGFTLEVSGAAATRVAKVDSTGTSAAYYDSTTTAYQGGFRVMNSSETSDKSITLVKVNATVDGSATSTKTGYNDEKTQFTVTGTNDSLSTHNILTGAKFYLYYKAEDEDEGKETKYYYGTTTVNGDKTVVQWSENLEDANKFEVGTDGSLTFNSLNENNTYYLVECQAPDGYSLLTEELKIEWTDSDNDGTKELTVTGVTSNQTYHLETVTTKTGEGDDAVTTTTTYLVVPNSSGYSLPETGGIGTHMFTLGGIAILAVITFMYGCGLRRKRERRAK